MNSSKAKAAVRNEEHSTALEPYTAVRPGPHSTGAENAEQAAHEGPCDIILPRANSGPNNYILFTIIITDE